jgi:hypothetical protein
MIGTIDTVLIWIEDNNNHDIYRISVKSTYRYLHEYNQDKQLTGKCGTGFSYQILTHMVKMEPERFTIIIDNGKRYGFSHMPVTSMDFQLFLHDIRKDSNEYTETALLELQKTVQYDMEHGINTNFMHPYAEEFYNYAKQVIA